MTSAALQSAANPALRLRRKPPGRRSALLATLLGLLIPGGGQVYMGRPGKALLMFVGIGGLIVGGSALTGWTCVSWDTHRLELLAHAFNLGPSAYLLHATQDFEVTEYLEWYEVGRQYVAIAGLLNLVAICDAWGHVLEHNRRAYSWQRILDRRARNAAQRLENERIRSLLAEQQARLDLSPELQPLLTEGESDSDGHAGEDDAG